MPSKKRSPISPILKLLEQSTPLFLDHNLGNKQLAATLRTANFKIECHLTHFGKEELDDVWIKKCAANGWVIVTCDRNIENDPINRQAVIDSGARIFFLEEGGSRSIFWAAAMIVSKNRLYEIIRDTKGPFFANISKETGFLVSNIRNPSADSVPATHPTSPQNQPVGSTP